MSFVFADAKDWCRKMCFTEVTRPLVKDFFDRLLVNGYRFTEDGRHLNIMVLKRGSYWGHFRCCADGENVCYLADGFLALGSAAGDEGPAKKLLEGLEPFMRAPEFQLTGESKARLCSKISYKTMIEHQDVFIALLNRYRYAVGKL